MGPPAMERRQAWGAASNEAQPALGSVLHEAVSHRTQSSMGDVSHGTPAPMGHRQAWGAASHRAYRAINASNEINCTSSELPQPEVGATASMEICYQENIRLVYILFSWIWVYEREHPLYISPDMRQCH